MLISFEGLKKSHSIIGFSNINNVLFIIHNKFKFILILINCASKQLGEYLQLL